MLTFEFIFNMRVLVAVCVMSITVFVVFFVKYIMTILRLKMPPGPKCLPLIGYIAPLSHLTLLNHADLYGDISGFHIFGTPFIILNSIDSIRDAFKSSTTADVFSARFSSFFKGYIIHDDVIMRSSSDKNWKAQRKLLHASLRSYGEGMTYIETVVRQELEHVNRLLRSRVGKDIDMDEIIAPSVQNIIYTLLNGERYSYDDRRIQDTLKSISVANYLCNPLIDTLLQYFPFIKFIPFGIGRKCQFVKKTKDLFLDTVLGICCRMSAKERETRQGISFDLLRQMEKSDWLNMEYIKGCVQNVAGAGSTTTRFSLYAFFLIMVHYPEITVHIQSEIDVNVGSDRNPILDDRENMPYTNAVILELTRFVTVVPIAIPHACAKDTQFRGMVVPRGALVIPNLFRVHHDDRLWTNPWVFDPSRFLDESGNLHPASHPSRHNLIAFGIGKRMCMGEAFAKTRMFLYITSILKEFTFQPCDKLPSCDPRTYVADPVIHPQPYKLKILTRF